MTLAPLLSIISMSTPSDLSIVAHVLASQLPGVLVLSLEQSLFAAEGCAHYAADYMQYSQNVVLTFADAATKIQCPHANPVVSYLCIPSSRCILITHRLHHHGRIFYLAIIILGCILAPVCVCSHTLRL